MHLCSMMKLLFYTLFISGITFIQANENLGDWKAQSQFRNRNQRSIRRYKGPGQRTSPGISQKNYSICMANGVTGACLQRYVCEAEGGAYMGECGSGGVCCNVVKSCGATTDAHAVLFQTPKFPKNETEGSFCSLTLKISEGICAIRMDLETFELYKYRKDYCPFDSFTVLGTKKLTGVLCGNMTGWQTTFEVEPMSVISVAAVLQGVSPSRFSTLFTMLPCNQIVTLMSPINAGVHNINAEEYTTTTTTTTTTTEEPTTTLETTTDPSEDMETTTQYTPPKRVVSDHKPTPLPVGQIVPAPTPESVIAKLDGDEGYASGDANDYLDPTPDSILKRIFNDRISAYERRSEDLCRRSGQLFTRDTQNTPEYQDEPNPGSLRSNIVDKCWFYDPNIGSYKINEDCLEEASQDEGFRIIGGKLANLNEYPWQVSLIYNKKMFCGGALISDRYVLTASHCLFGSFSKGIHLLKVTLGDHDLRTKNETENVLASVRRVIWNVHYNSMTTENDIGLLELMEPVDFSYSILPINLPTDLSYDYSGANATVTGWGRMDFRSKKKSAILKEYTGTIDNIDECVKSWAKYPAISAIKDIHLCLNVTFGSPCHGDSGGPLITCNRARCTLIGIVSFGFPLCRNVGLPAVFSKVTSYKRWIDINTSRINYYTI